ncbi:MAG: TrkH family potassium uptake protein, partial [Limnochordia bacterium]
MNFGMVARVIGSLLLLEAAILTIPLGVSIYFQEQAGIWGLALSMGIAAFVGVVLVSLRGTSSRLKNREAILIVTLGWFFTSLFAALP